MHTGDTWSPVVTTCTTYCNIQNLHILHALFVFRVMVPVNSDYFLKQRNRLVFVMEIACVLCEVRTEFLRMV